MDAVAAKPGALVEPVLRARRKLHDDERVEHRALRRRAAERQLELHRLVDRQRRRKVRAWPCARSANCPSTDGRRDDDRRPAARARPAAGAGCGRARRGGRSPTTSRRARAGSRAARAAAAVRRSATTAAPDARRERRAATPCEPADVREREPEPRARRRGRARVPGRTRHAITSPRRFVDLRRADPGDRVEVVDRGERPVLLAVVDDLLRRHRPDPGKRVELLDRRGVEVDRSGGDGAPAAARPGSRQPARAGDRPRARAPARRRRAVPRG